MSSNSSKIAAVQDVRGPHHVVPIADRPVMKNVVLDELDTVVPD